MKKHAKRKGFTFVELLIAIILIVILSARMLLTSREGSVSALAADILADFENIRTAATAYYVEHSREILSSQDWSFDNKDAKVLFAGYLTNTNVSQSTSGEKNQYILLLDKYKNWYVSCYVSNESVMQKLKAQLPNVELCEPPQSASEEAKNLTKKTGNVGICILKRNLNKK